MAYIQKLSVPTNKVLSFSLKDFSGGLNNKSDQLKDTEASDLLNMSFVDTTLMEKRKGQMYYDTFICKDKTRVPFLVEFPNDINYIDEYKPYTSKDVLIKATDGKVYFDNVEILESEGKISGVNFTDKYFFSDGSQLYAYGIFAQETTIYEVVTGIAIATPVLMKVVSPVDGFVPLDATHVQGVLQVDYDKFEIAYEPCKNEIGDTSKGANIVPDGINFIVYHNGRLFMSGADKDDDNIFITDVQNPYYFPVTLPIQIPPDSDRVTGLAVFDDSVVIGRKNDMYAIFGETNNTTLGLDLFELKRINTQTGFANHNATDIVNNSLYFLGGDYNVYALNSTRYGVRILSTSLLSKTIDLTKTPINISEDDIEVAYSIFFENEWYLTIKDKVLVYSFFNQAWTMYDNFNARSFYNLDGELIWGNHYGVTAKFSDDTYLDFGLPYKAFWYSRYFDMNEANTFKHFREVFLTAHVYDDYKSDINVVFEIDYVDVKDIFLVSNQISTFGETVWGARFITRNIVESLPLIIGRRGRNLRFKISNGYYIDGSVDWITDLANYPGKKDGTLVEVLVNTTYGDAGLYLLTKGDWVLQEDLNQKMKIYQVNGDYELRGKR